jgi:hypothetical protein
MIMTTRMFRRETSEQLEISHQPMRDVTLLLFGPTVSWRAGSDNCSWLLLTSGPGLINGMTFPLCFLVWLLLVGEENVAFHSTIPFYVAFWWNVAATAKRHV